MGIPFRCYRCHGFGHLAHECSLPFNKPSSTKVWRVKKGGIQSDAKVGSSVEENLDMHYGSHEPEPPKLKSLSISNSLDELGNFPYLNHSSVALSPTAPNLSLKDLGFVSPCKASPIVSKGYYLRSCSKSVQEVFRPVEDQSGNLKAVKGLIGDEKVLHFVMNGVGALRASSLNKASI